MQCERELQLPPQSQLLLPLLHELRDAGGYARPGELYDKIAARIGLDDDTRNATVDAGRAGRVNAFERHVRWTRQTCVAKGLIANAQRGRWELTDRANAKLQNIIRGTIVTIFETDNGFFLWANAEDAVGLIEPGSVGMLLSSPPYPLLRPKEYQLRENRDARAWIDWMMRLAEGWRELLTPTGSMMINIGPVWEPGEPRQSTYIERFLIALEDQLGLGLCQRLSWENKAKLPAPLEWVGIRRIRVKDTIEPILWVAPNPSAVLSNTRRVLKPYSKSALRAIANPQDGTRKRPSGFTFGPSSFKDNGGAIPSANILTSNAASASRYRRAERARGRVPHPAMMPDDVAEYCIKLASAEGDVNTIRSAALGPFRSQRSASIVAGSRRSDRVSTSPARRSISRRTDSRLASSRRPNPNRDRWAGPSGQEEPEVCH